MSNKQALEPDDSDRDKKKWKRYRVEKDRMDYEGGNQGKSAGELPEREANKSASKSTSSSIRKR